MQSTLNIFDIEAVEFAVKNDDGQHPRNLRKADIVLVGISRTSKTPLSTYLAQRGYKVANVPLVMGIEPFRAFSIDQKRIFALSIDPDALFRIRQLGCKASVCRPTLPMECGITSRRKFATPNKFLKQTPTGQSSK